MTITAERNGHRSLIGHVLDREPRTLRVTDRPRRGHAIATWVRRHASIVRSKGLTVVGLASPVVAAFEWHPLVGWVALGIAGLLLDRSFDRDESDRESKA